MDTRAEITNLLNPILKIFSEAFASAKNINNDRLKEYLYVQTEKYFFTTNFIYRDEKIRFLDFYYPIKTKYKNRVDNFKNLRNTFDEYKNIVLSGKAGSGKSTLIKYMFLQSISQKFKIPVLIKLRNLNSKDILIEDYIIGKLMNGKVNPNERTLLNALDKGNFIFLLDGYDEIYSESKIKIDEEISDFCDKYAKNNFVITSRPGTGANGIAGFTPFQVQGLQLREIDSFIVKASNGDKEFADSAKLTIRENESKAFKEYLKNPLLLSMFLTTFRDYPRIPEKKNIFYRNVFETLYCRHDATSKGTRFRREFRTKLEKDEFEEILGLFSSQTFFKGKFSFSIAELQDELRKIIQKLNKSISVDDLIKDLHVSISILIRDGNYFSFPHRSLQEYFCALFINSCSIQQKEVIFDKYTEILQRKSKDLSYDFWDLNEELNFADFNRFFILKNLNSFLRNTNGQSSFNNLIAMHSALGIKYSMDREAGSEAPHYLIMEYRSNLNMAIFIYVGLINGQMSEMRDFVGVGLSDELDKLEIISNSDQDSINLKSIWCNEVYECFVNSGVEENYLNLMNRLIEKIQEISKKVEDANEIRDDFIDLL